MGEFNSNYGDTIEDTITKPAYDRYCIKNMLFSLDLYMFHTVKTMLVSRAAQ